jgi:hypothetical protein
MSNVDSHLFHFLLLGATIAVAAPPAGAQPRNAGSVQRGGVSITVHYLHDRSVFCIDADATHKISAEYGIEFRVPKKDIQLWSERFPKVVNGEGRYFSLPLQVELMARGDVIGRHVTVELGACSSEALCDTITFDLAVPRDDARGERQAMRCDHQ